MNTFLWILQSSLAFMFIMAGGMKVFHSRKKLLQLAPVYSKLPIILPRLLGVMEIFGAIGIIIPILTNIYSVLTPVAAVCLGIV